MPLRYLPTLVLAACLVYSPARAEAPNPGKVPATLTAPTAGASPSAEPSLPSATTPLSAEPVLPAAPTQESAEPVRPETSFADETHDSLERGILQQVVRLDNFFGKVNSKKEQRSAYYLRWRSSARLEQGDGLKLGTALRANVSLSRISERLKLTISGENEPDPFAPSLPEDPGNPGFDRTTRNARIVNTELRYQLIRAPDSDLFTGVGVDLAWPPKAFARARYNYSHKFSEVTVAHLTETMFAKTPYGVGETTELSLERLLAPKTVLRWASSGTVSQEIGALEWGSELSLLHELSSRGAITASAGVFGTTGQDDVISNYRLLLRYRRNFLRSWLFFELEPEITWPRGADGSFPAAYAVTFRLEVVFQGQEKKAPETP
jgi:hypothetical protein